MIPGSLKQFTFAPIKARIKPRTSDKNPLKISPHPVLMTAIKAFAARSHQGEGFPASGTCVRTISRGTARADNLNLAVVGDFPRRRKHDPLAEGLPGIDAMPGKTRGGDRSKHQVVSTHSGGDDRLWGNQYQSPDSA
jgi:hypothetical protein